MKLALVIDVPPWRAVNRWFIRRIEESFALCAVLTVDGGSRSRRRVGYLIRKHGYAGALPKLAAGLLFRRHTRRIGSAVEARFGPLAGDYQPSAPVIHIGSLSDDALPRWLDEHRPDVVVPFAGGIIREHLLDRCAWVRWHHGITPDIRGLASSYWAIHDNRPEWLGLTIQRLAKKLDSGAILAQQRLVPTSDDDLASVQVKLDELCLDLLLGALGRWRDGESNPRPCDPGLGCYRSSPTLMSLIRFPTRQRTFFRQFAGTLQRPIP